MFEFGISCVILLAVGYWATLWYMGRHDDVLHGKFVHPELAVDGEMPVEAQPPFPKRPARPVPQVRNAPAPVSSDTLQSLLAEIKQDLKDVA